LAGVIEWAALGFLAAMAISIIASLWATSSKAGFLKLRQLVGPWLLCASRDAASVAPIEVFRAAEVKRAQLDGEKTAAKNALGSYCAEPV